MGTTVGLVTVAEFMQLPDRNGVRLELHHGHVIEAPPATSDHAEIQDRIAKALEGIAASGWSIRTELAFRPKPEHEVWEADVGVMTRDRWEHAVAEKAYLLGAPEIVIEVLSPSNRASEMYDRERTCLEGGCQEFWVVDPKTQQIRVTSPDGVTRPYRSGEHVPVPMLGGSIAVDAVFAQ